MKPLETREQISLAYSLLHALTSKQIVKGVASLNDVLET